MKIILKKTLSLLILISLLFLMCNISGADVPAPAKIRVGIYYTESATASYTAVSSFNVCAKMGLQLGYCNAGVFTVLYEEPTTNVLTIRKEDTTTGAFHIQIGAVYNSYADALVQVQAYKALAIPAYPVFVDSWQVWTGSYMDQNTANTDLTTNLQLKLPGVPCTVVQPSANRIIAQSAAGEVLLLFGSDVNRFQIHPKAENNPYMLKLNKSNYRGDLEVRRFATSDMTVINIVTMDQYLYGVVPSEIGGSSPAEAMKAQAVAARSYAMGRMGNHPKLDFDVTPTDYDQVYKGYDIESAAADKAVDDTSGKKVTYNGKLAQTFFFSSDGGATEDAKNVWGTDVPYLKSVSDPYESGKTYHYNWTVNKTASAIKQVMQGKNKNLGDILSVKITKTAPTGRVTEVLITGTLKSQPYPLESARTVFGLDSQWYSISTDAEFWVINGSGTKVKTQLSSNNVMTANGLKPIQTVNNGVQVIGADSQRKTIPIIPTNYTFTGKGWGHSVGMSQDGAIGMAKAGFTYDQILKYFYTGANVE